MKILFVALLALSAYVYAAEAISCYVCESKDTTKSKSRAKDNCNPRNVGKDYSKESKETPEEDDCDYCLTTTRHFDAGYFQYGRYCVTTGTLAPVLAYFGSTCRNDNDKDKDPLVADYTGYSLTATCCSTDFCNTNSATNQLVTIISTLLPIIVAVFWF